MPTPTHRLDVPVAVHLPDGTLVDLTDTAPETNLDGLRSVTLRSDEGLDILRHTLAAQVLARAVKQLYPEAELGAGPTVENGFYYDVRTDKPISADDLPAIEQAMREIIAKGATITKRWLSISEAKRLFQDKNEPFKVEIIDTAEAEGASQVSVYYQDGSDFVDLCRGPHLPRIGIVDPEAFNLISVSGSYWRGDSQRPSMTRIHGTAWRNKKELRTHLDLLADAKRRDHRTLARAMGLFHLDGNACPGQVFWRGPGWRMFTLLSDFVTERALAAGHEVVNTPRLVSRPVYEVSGHWEKFGTENMFTTDAYGGGTLALKPMNCPEHVLLYNSEQHSYRDLPVRFAEFGNCYRRELPGALHGLMRVVSMTQDDAHVICAPEQVRDEIVHLHKLIDGVYQTLGFSDYYVRFADRPERRIGSDAVWDAAESALMDACVAAGVEVVSNPGEGAFYGPKLEYVLRDVLGREWQCGTVQLDFNLPSRFGATYTTSDATAATPVMIHRAIIGTVERFLGIFLEHHADWIPFWIAPTQVALVPASTSDYPDQVHRSLIDAGIRCVLDTSGDRLANVVRRHSSARVPLIVVVGDQEAEHQTVSVRRFGSRATHTVPLDAFIQDAKSANDTRSLRGPDFQD